MTLSQSNRNTGVREMAIDIPDDPLPLARLGKALEQTFGFGISYEDAPWVYSADIDVAPEYPNRRKEALGGGRVARGGSLSIKFSVTEDGQDPTVLPARILQDALDLHRRKGNPGEFRLLPLDKDGFSIVALRSRDAEGRLVSSRPPLDNRISFPDAKMTGDDALDLILKSASIASHNRIERVNHPFYPNYSARIGANNEVARDVLLRLVHELAPSDPLDTSGRMRRIAWQLTYDPNSGNYWFDWRLVIRATVSPGGKGVLYAPVEIPRSRAPR